MMEVTSHPDNFISGLSEKVEFYLIRMEIFKKFLASTKSNLTRESLAGFSL